MNDTNKHTAVHWVRQSVVVTLILLLLCGVGFPVVLGGLSAVMFPSQAKGSLVTADGEAVGAANVGQDFAEPYFMKCRPSACNYNTHKLRIYSTTHECKSDIRPLANQKLHLIAQLAHFLS